MSNDINSTQRDELATTLDEAVEVFYEPFDWHESTRIAARILAAGYRKPRTITTVGDMAGPADRTVFRTAEGHVFEVQGGQLLRSDSTTWWSSLASWLPVTVLDEPAAACTGVDSFESPTHIHGCFA